MVKLATSTQYESSMDELNMVRPLLLKDTGKTTLDIPVLCSNPVNRIKPAIGRLLQCDEQGSLIRSNSRKYTNYQIKTGTVAYYSTKKTIAFSQKVFIVSVRVTYKYHLTGLAIYDPSYTEFIKPISLTGSTVISIVVNNLYFQGFGGSQWSCNFECIGFY